MAGTWRAIQDVFMDCTGSLKHYCRGTLSDAPGNRGLCNLLLSGLWVPLPQYRDCSVTADDRIASSRQTVRALFCSTVCSTFSLPQPLQAWLVPQHLTQRPLPPLRRWCSPWPWFSTGKISANDPNFSLTRISVFQPLDAMPKFWTFMYYISPFTYIIGGIAASGLHGVPISCSKNELSVMDPPPNYTCGDYLQEYLDKRGGRLYNPSAIAQCQYCPVSSADQFLLKVGISWSNRWRNFGFVWAYIVFNCLAAVLLYYACRVRRQ